MSMSTREISSARAACCVPRATISSAASNSPSRAYVMARKSAIIAFECGSVFWSMSLSAACISPAPSRNRPVKAAPAPIIARGNADARASFSVPAIALARSVAREVRTRLGDLAALAAEVGNPEVGLAKELGFGVLAGSHRQLQVIDLTPARLESPRSLGLPHGRSQLQLALRFVRKAARAAEEA